MDWLDVIAFNQVENLTKEAGAVLALIQECVTAVDVCNDTVTCTSLRHVLTIRLIHL